MCSHGAATTHAESRPRTEGTWCPVRVQARGCRPVRSDLSVRICVGLVQKLTCTANLQPVSDPNVTREPHLVQTVVFLTKHFILGWHF